MPSRRKEPGNPRPRHADRAARRPTDAPPLFAFAALIVVTIGAAVLSIPAAWELFPGPYMRQWTALRRGDRPPGDRQIAAALERQPSAARMVAAVQALAAASEAVRGQLAAEVLPNIERNVASDADNRVTRLSIAVAKSVTPRAATTHPNDDPAGRFAAFRAAWSATPASTARLYGSEWRDAWAALLEREGLPRDSAYRDSVQTFITPHSVVRRAWIENFPTVIDAALRLADDLRAADRPGDSAEVRAAVSQTCRGLLDTEATAYLALLAADCLARATPETGAWRDRFRAECHAAADGAPRDIMDPMSSPALSPDTARPYLASLAAAMTGYAVLLGALAIALALAINHLRSRCRAVTEAHDARMIGAEPRWPAPAWLARTAAALLINAAYVAVVVSAVVRSDMPREPGLIAISVSGAVVGFVSVWLATRWKLRSPGVATALLIVLGCFTVPLMPLSAILAFERAVGGPIGAVVVLTVVILGALVGLAYRATRVPTSPAASGRAAVLGLVIALTAAISLDLTLVATRGAATRHRAAYVEAARRELADRIGETRRLALLAELDRVLARPTTQADAARGI